MAICTALLIMGLFLAGAMFLLEWKMPGFLMGMIKNGIANGRAYAEKRQDMKDKGVEYKESFYDFTKGFKHTVTFRPPNFDEGARKSKKKSK